MRKQSLSYTKVISVRFKFQCRSLLSVKKTCFFIQFLNVFESMHVLILALHRGIIKTKFAYLFFWLNGFLIVLIESF